jgi:hypothetical protein
MTRRARAFVGVAVIAFALATPLGGRAMGRACAAGNVHIAVVVDSGSGSSVSAVCVPMGARDNGATLLAARAAMLGTPQPSFDGRSGLLCAIDGFPQSGCGKRTGGHYAYWAYFHGINGRWEYSNIGPGGTRVNPSVVEGWRFQPDGAGLPTDPPPRAPATATSICVPQAPPTTARPVVAGTTAPHAGATTPAVVPGATAPVIGPPSPGTAGADGRVTPTTRSTAKSTIRDSTATTARDRSSTTVADRAATATTSSSITLTAGGIAAGPGEPSSGGAPVGVIVGELLVVGLGAGGAIAARRRRPAS